MEIVNSTYREVKKMFQTAVPPYVATINDDYHYEVWAIKKQVGEVNDSEELLGYVAQHEDCVTVGFNNKLDEKIKEEVAILRDFIEKKEAQQQKGIVENTQNGEGLVNGTIETNLGLFRAYMTLYLQQHKFVSDRLILMVRTLDPTDNGLPLQLYCFSNNTDWVCYESIQSEIFEHYAAIMPQFGLYPFQNPSSRDYINAALLTAGHKPDELWGIPFGTMKPNPATVEEPAKPDRSVTSPPTPQPPIPPK